MGFNYAAPRVQQCDSAGCSQRGRQWTVEPREVQPGLLVWETVMCAECGCTPPIVRSLDPATSGGSR